MSIAAEALEQEAPAGAGLAGRLEPLRACLAAGGVATLAEGTWLHRLADATDAAAVAQLRAEASATAPTLLLAHPAEAADWLPPLSRRAGRFCRRAWLKPATLRFDHDGEHGLASRLPAEVREWIATAGTLGFLLPDSVELQELAQEVDFPILIAAEPLPQDEPAPAAVGVEYRWKDEEPLLPGGEALPPETRPDLLLCDILFICTGNTCRSPMAEALFKKLLADRLGCASDELPRHGWRVRSAGLTASAGYPASEGAQQAAAQRSLSLAGHQSQPVTLGLLSEADHVYTMTANHWRALAGRLPSADSTLELLSPQGFDIMDPYGADQAAYDACAQMIEEQLALRLAEFADELPAAAATLAETPAPAPAEPKG